MDLDVIVRYLPLLWHGLLVTVYVSGLTLVLGTMIGALLAMMRISPTPLLRIPTAIYVWVFRGIPVLVVLFFAYYALPHLGLRLGAFAAAITGMTVTAAAYKCEIIRAGIEAVGKGQIDAADAAAMTYWQKMRHVILPQAIRTVIPPYINNAVLIVKNSALVSVITVPDLTLTATQVVSSTYRAVEIYSTIGVMYLILTSILMLLQQYGERRLSYYAR